MDNRPVNYGRVGPAPYHYEDKICNVWRELSSLAYDPEDVERMLALDAASPQEPLYACDIELGSMEFGGRRDATLLDVPMPEIDEYWELVHPTSRFNYIAWAPTAIAASDDGLGAVGMMHPGIASATCLMSDAFACSRLHAEDGFLGSSNLLVCGAPKIWYVVAPEYGDTYMRSLGPSREHVPASKCFQPRLPCASLLADGRVTRIVQRPGQLVVTQPGFTMHWTVSCGRSLCEASNYFLDCGLSVDCCTARSLLYFRRCLAAARKDDARSFCQSRVDSAVAIRNDLGLLTSSSAVAEAAA